MSASELRRIACNEMYSHNTHVEAILDHFIYMLCNIRITVVGRFSFYFAHLPVKE